MDELASVLSREQLLLERLLFKLIELRAMLVDGEARFLPWAAEEVDRATARLREAELRRAVVVNRVASEVGVVDAQVSLRALSQSTPEPYAAIFAAQRRAMLGITAEVRDCVRACRVSAGAGASIVQEVLQRVGVEAEGAMASAPFDDSPIPLVVMW